ncbi:MAG: ATP-binding protein [Burkholderiales bacterium]
MSFRRMSLQARLVALMLAAMVLFGLLAGYESYENAMQEADELFDAQLAQNAQTLLAVATHGDDDDREEDIGPGVHKYQQAMLFQVWATDESVPRLVLRSSNAPRNLLDPMPPPGFSNGTWQGERWRYYRQKDERRALETVVGQGDRARHELAGEVAWHNLLPFLLGLPLLGLAALAAIGFGLRPLRKLAQEVSLRSPDRLDPIRLGEMPREIAPVVESLNKLLDRVAATLENERRFTADAAHELRTPLAALRAQAQAALLADDPAEQRKSLSMALQGADRMNHLVDQLLTLARLDALAPSDRFADVDLAAVVRKCCAEAGTEALAKKIDLELDADRIPPIAGSADLLPILVRNLLDNAIRYTPAGGRVVVAICMEDGSVSLDVADSGPGVPDAQLASLGRRFSRLNPDKTEGVGLGLSIVLRIAAIHRAPVAFARASETGGLKVSISFGESGQA